MTFNHFPLKGLERRHHCGVNYICSLQTGGKLSPEEAYKPIQILWKQLKISKKELEIS
ncbi:MAG: hypothetical protein MET45_07360 [Nostoc sp. LLA-1]|nr:hypothetical protein [Cyanocohniella sp. LLY]